MRIDTALYLVWCDELNIDESNAHQAEATSHSEAIDLVCQSLWECGEWPAPANLMVEVAVCNATGPRDERWFFCSVRPTFDIVRIEQEIE